MIYISKEGEVISTANETGDIVKLYDSWKAGQKEYLITTSGSTGTPKQIILHRKAITASIEATRKAFNLTSEDLFVCNMNTDFIGGKMMVFRAAELGCDLVSLTVTSNPFDELGNQVYLIAQNWGKNFFSFVPLQLRNILQKEEHIQLLRTAKAILVGGGPVPADVRDQIKNLQLPVFETYGMTETISHIALKDLREGHTHFTALENVSLDTDENSCLKIKSASTSDQWITTNDIVELLSANTFILKGRKDNVINSGGIKIQLEEVDHILAENLTQNFFTYGLEDKILGQKLILVTEGPPIDEAKAFAGLPKYHTPREVFYIERIERTPSGKIDKLKTVEHLKS